MAEIAGLLKVCQALVDAGLGKEDFHGEHDVLYLPGAADAGFDSEEYKAVGIHAHYDELEECWLVFC